MKQTFAKALVVATAAMMGFASFAFAGTSTTPVFTQTQESADIHVAGGGNTASTGGASAPLIDTIKKAVNLILGFLGLISLIILLRGGFQMVTAAGDDGKYKKGFTILRQAGIGLIFVGLSALFVNLIFWLIGAIA